jgi:hypothetical protein
MKSYMLRMIPVKETKTETNIGKSGMRNDDDYDDRYMLVQVKKSTSRRTSAWVEVTAIAFRGRQRSLEGRDHDETDVEGQPSPGRRPLKVAQKACRSCA